MKITVRNYSVYKEVTIESDNTVITTGFLNEKESMEVAVTFLNAATDLVNNNNAYGLISILDEWFEAVETARSKE